VKRAAAPWDAKVKMRGEDEMRGEDGMRGEDERCR